MNKLGGVYHDDERVNYNFSFYDNEGKHVEVRFRAEPDYDLDIIFNEFRNFLIATNHDIEGQIGELGVDDDDWEDESAEQSLGVDCVEKINDFYASKDKLVQNPTQIHQDKFSMDHLPNNGWPFGGLTTESIPALTPEQIAALTVKPIDLSQVNQYPTMSPITQEQIKSWKFDAPGTIGGVKVSYK